jgi:two-component system, NarL family, nitrate/nitrite response regulator NarL
VAHRDEALEDHTNTAMPWAQVYPADAHIRILVGDGHAVMREGLQRLLSGETGFEVVAEALDPGKLVSMAEHYRPEVILLESGLGGESVAALLRRLELVNCQSRIIIMTASTRQDDHVQFVRCGASGIMTRETSSEMLVKGIRKVCAGELWVERRTIAEAMRQMVAARAALPLPRGGANERGTAALSKREREIATLVAQGFKNKDIAGRLFISEQTVKNHMHNIFEKLGVSDRLELALLAIHHGLI